MTLPQESAAIAQLPPAGHDVPPGFVPYLAHQGGFVDTCCTFYVNRERLVVAARIISAHLNPLRIAHGGLLATLADTALGTVIKMKMGTPYPPITASLVTDYMSPAREGDWVEARVEIDKQGSRIVNATCTLWVGARLITRATGVFLPNGGMPRAAA